MTNYTRTVSGNVGAVARQQPATSSVLPDDLFAGMLCARTQWFATCAWCLTTVYREPTHPRWVHLDNGQELCRQPLTGLADLVTAAPTPPGTTAVAPAVAVLNTARRTGPAVADVEGS